MRSILTLVLATVAVPCVAQRRCVNCQPAVRVVAEPVVQEVIELTAGPEVFVINNTVPAIPQGTTAFSGYGNSLSLDLDRLTQQTILLQQAADQSSQTRNSQTLTFLQQIVAIQAQAQKYRERGIAAEKVLRAAGLVDDEQVTQQTLPKLSLLDTTCVACHSGDSPKGNFRMDVEFDTVKALNKVATGQMPPPEHKTVTPEERLLLIQELLSSVTNRGD